MSGLAVKRLGGLVAFAALVIPTAQPPNRLSHNRSLALRRRWRLVRQPVEPPQSAGRAARADDASRRGPRARRDTDRAGAVGRPLHLYDRSRQRALLRRRNAQPASLSGAGRLSARR